MIDIFERMGGGPVAVGEVPYYYYYPHGMYRGGGPLSSRNWLPAYTFSGPSRRGNGDGYYFFNDGDLEYGQDDDEVNFVDFPAGHVPNSARKRKLGREIVEPHLRGEAGESGSIPVVQNGRLDFSPERKPAQPYAGSGSFAVPVEGSSKVSSTRNGEESYSQPMDVVESSPTMSPAHTENVMATEMTKEPSKRLAASAADAAVAVQSLYRGYMVRRTKPLEQLRVIAAIKAQLTQLEGKVADPDFIEYLREHTSGRLKLSESVMRLLLQLDGIQGAHSEVRDIRKSLTRKVIAFQEQVDKLLSGSEGDVMDLDVKHEDNMPKLSDKGGQEHVSATGGELQSLDEESVPLSTVESDDEMSPQRGVSTDNGTMNVDKLSHDREQNNVQYRSGEINIDGNELIEGDVTRSFAGAIPVDGRVKETSGHNFVESQAGTPRSSEAAIPIDGVENGRNGERDASRLNMDTSLHPASNGSHIIRANGLNDSANLMTPTRHLNNGLDAGSLGIWRDVHVDNRTNRREDDAVDTTMTNGSGEVDGRNTPPPSEDDGEKKRAEAKELYRYRDDIFKQFNDYDASKLASARDITAGAAVMNNSILPDFRKGTASLQGKDDKDVMLQKLSDENQMLKSLLVGIMKWNQLQAGSMNDLSNRLGNLEQHVLKSSRRSRRTAEDECKDLRKLLGLPTKH